MAKMYGGGGGVGVGEGGVGIFRNYAAWNFLMHAI